jgi:hypothetical protein
VGALALVVVVDGEVVVAVVVDAIVVTVSLLDDPPQPDTTSVIAMSVSEVTYRCNMGPPKSWFSTAASRMILQTDNVWRLGPPESK